MNQGYVDMPTAAEASEAAAGAIAVRPAPSAIKRPADNIRRDERNVFATMAVFGGITSWVPLVIVLALPLTYISAILALIFALRKDSRKGLSAALVGVTLGTAALGVHLAVAAVGGAVGWIGSALG